MYTTRFVLLGLVLSATKMSSSSVLYLAKCCPPGQVFSGHAEVKCVSLPNSAIELHVLHRNGTTKYQGLPRCDEPENIVTSPLADLIPAEFSEVPACLEILHEPVTGESTAIVVHCRSNVDRQVKAINVSVPRFAYVRKCCPRDTIFDERTRACVSRLINNSADSLVTFLVNGSADVNFAMVITEGPPRCDGPIVDYAIDQDDVLLRNGAYLVTVPAFKDNLIAKEEFRVADDHACLDTTPDSALNRRLVARVCREPEFCDGNACVRKCCAEDEFFYTQGCDRHVTPEEEPTGFHQALTQAVNETESSAFDTTKDYGLLVGKPCKYGMYPVNSREEEWSLTSGGHVFAEGYQMYDQNEYCMDFFYNSSRFDQGFYLFICFDEPTTEEYSPIRYRVNTALELTSCAFLLMTLLVYACLPSLQNLHGKTLMCHVSSLFLAFGCLAIIPWIMPARDIDEDEERKATMMCKSLAYTMLFSFLSAFFWLNVMCFDIWWTFGNLRGNTITKRRGHGRRFLLYCSYAWGLPLLVSILAIVADCTDILPVYLQPNIGYTSCWFTQNPDSYGELTFFIGPLTIQLVSNVVFFVLTSVHCNKVKAEIKRVTSDPRDPKSKRFRSDRSRFVMNIKLFVVMGISWICEVVSFFLKRYFHYIYWHHALFYASDAFNCLQGLLIFILFVLKSRVYLALRRRLGLDAGRKPTCNATMALQDPYKVRKSVSNSTIMSTFAISSAP